MNALRSNKAVDVDVLVSRVRVPMVRGSLLG
jgi:hypothetical protein